MAASVQAPLEAADPLLQAAHSAPPLLDVAEADGAAFLLPSQAAPTRVGSPLPGSCAAASGECTAGEVVGPFAHKETCVVLDWDDTLFPSSFGACPGRAVDQALRWPFFYVPSTPQQPPRLKRSLDFSTHTPHTHPTTTVDRRKLIHARGIDELPAELQVRPDTFVDRSIPSMGLGRPITQ